jgi:hypothetical protein
MADYNFTKTWAEIDALTGNAVSKIQLDTSTDMPWAAGQLSYNTVEKTIDAGTGFTDVSNCLGRENHILAYNDTGVQIDNGEPVSVTGVITGLAPNIVPTDTTSILSTRAFAGVATMNIPDGEQGIVASFGHVHGVNTSTLSLGFIYADGLGGYTQTRPKYPQNRLLVGGVIKVGVLDGVLSVGPQLISRSPISSVYPFTSNGVGIGSIYIAGSYDWEATDANLNQGALSVTHGTLLAATGAHIGIVAGGAGSVDAGVVGIRVNGTSFTDDGITTALDSEILTSDITAMTLNEYLETSKNWTGQVTIELFTVSGTPTTYSADFNYGFSAYIDASNSEFTITGFRVEGLCGGTDGNFNVTLKKHSSAGWTYAATGFAPGDGDLADMSTDMAPNDVIVNGKEFKYKRADLDTYIDGTGSEGFLIEVNSSNNNAVQSMVCTVSGFSEGLS